VKANSRNSTWQQLAGICGMLSPFVAFAAISIAISNAPPFAWKENWLSDLGVYEGASHYFNTGIFFTGILGIGLGSGLYLKYIKSRTSRIGATLFISGSVALCGVGVFTENAGDIHFYTSALFFILVPLSIIIMGVYDIVQYHIKQAYLTTACATSAYIAWLLPWPGTGGALPEAAAAILLGIVSFIYGMTLVAPYCPLKNRQCISAKKQERA